MDEETPIADSVQKKIESDMLDKWGAWFEKNKAMRAYLYNVSIAVLAILAGVFAWDTAVTGKIENLIVSLLNLSSGAAMLVARKNVR